MVGEAVRADLHALRELSVRATDCLRLVYKLSERGERVTTSAMRERLQGLESSGQLSDASVTQLFKSLSEMGYVQHTPYRGVTLTDAGRAAATELVRQHRLLELYLVRHLGYRWDEVDAEAERLEHAVSQKFIERVDALLGHPTVDPHGDPIPSRTGEVHVEPTIPLAELESGTAAVVRRVADDDPEMLRYLDTLALVPGARVQVLERAPFGGLIRLQVTRNRQRQEHAVGRDLAETIRVSRLAR